MKAGWQAKELGTVSAINYGYTESASSEPVGPRFLRITDIQDDRVNWESVPYCKIESVDIPKYRLASGDIVFARTGATTGKSFLVDDPPDAVFASYLIRLRLLDKSLLPEFVSLFFQTGGYWQSIKDGSTGSAQGGFNATKLGALTIPVPPFSEQQRIVGLLDEAFTSLATAKANAEKNLQNARALFESHLQSVFTQHGATWDKVTLQTLLDRGWIESHLDGNHGSDYPRKDEFISEGIPYISANCLDNERIDMSCAKYLSPSRAAQLRKGIAKDNDVLFAHNATVGPVAILHTDEEKVILGTSLTYYRCNPKHILPEYLAHYMRSFGFKSQYSQVMKQSTRNQVPITTQREFFHVIPPLEEQKHIVGALDGLFENGQRLASLYERKLAALEELKKSLLHQAFTGELTKGSAPVVIPFPIPILTMADLDLHAGILAIAYEAHEKANRVKYFGHVKAEKISHMVEALAGIELGRHPVKDAAGPNDFQHLKNVEFRSRKAGYFEFTKQPDGNYELQPGRNFTKLIARTRQALGDLGQKVDDLIKLMLPLDTQQAEIFATVHAAWNNLLLDKQAVTDELIVTEARENWHPDKLKIARHRFFEAIKWIRRNDISPQGKGKKVMPKVA